MFELLGSSADGLSVREAAERLEQFGRNELRVRKATPEIVRFLRQFRNLFAVLLIIGGLLALLAEKLAPGEGNRYIAWALFAVTLLNAVFTYVQEREGEKIMETFREMLPRRVTVLRDGFAVRLAAEGVVPGDVILLNAGDRICADGRLLEQNRMKIDLSSVTGESEPKLRHLECTHENILESRNMIFSGTTVQSGDGQALIYATGMNTQIGRIVEMTKEIAETETPIRRELRHFIRVISSIAVVLGIVFFALGSVIGMGEINSLLFAIGIIVANVPEGLLPTVTLALTMASRRMAQKNALIRRLESVETLGSTTVICTDKTGTLTQNRTQVSSVIIGQVEFTARDPHLRGQEAVSRLLQVMTLCNNAVRTPGGFAGDPTEVALLTYAGELQGAGERQQGDRILELPFDSATRRMITVNRFPGGAGYVALLKGAPEAVLDRCDRHFLGGEKVSLNDEVRREIIGGYQRLAMRGERVLALAARELSTPELTQESGFTLIGLVGMLDPPRPEVFDAMRRCRRAGIRVIMISGDHELTAETIARQIGLLRDEGKVVLGDKLAAMSDAQLGRTLAHPQLVFARTTPVQKLRIVKALQAKGEIVTVTGDGVNDAPALKNADMGVSMGVIGTDVAREASDLVLMDDNFATIVAAIEEGRTIFENIRKFIAYILTSNVPEILPFIAFVLLGIPLPLTIVLILCIDLGTDILPAIAVGAELPETDVMRNPPRPRHERLLSRNLLLMSYGVFGMMQAAAGFFSYFVVLYAGGWAWGEALQPADPLYRTAVTAFFASIILCQIANVLICRTRHGSLFTAGLFSNPLILLGIAAELLILGLIAYLPAMNAIFGTAPLQPWHLLLSVPFAFFMLLAEELRRVLARRGQPFVLRWLSW